MSDFHPIAFDQQIYVQILQIYLFLGVDLPQLTWNSPFYFDYWLIVMGFVELSYLYNVLIRCKSLLIPLSISFELQANNYLSHWYSSSDYLLKINIFR